MNQVIINQTFGWKIICFRSWNQIHVFIGNKLIVFETWRTYCIWVSNETHSTGACIGNNTSRYFIVTVIITEIDSIPSNGIKKAICNFAIFSTFHKNSTSAVCRPVTSQELFFVIHESTKGLGKFHTINRNITYSFFLSSTQFK